MFLQINLYILMVSSSLLVYSRYEGTEINIPENHSVMSLIWKGPEVVT